MPIYEYQCESCEHKLEAIQKVSEDPLTVCPACGKDSLRKLISAVAFHLKGTGWYATDFKDKPKQKDESKKPESISKDKKDNGESKKSDADTSKSDKKESASTTDD